jgi:hypothetical protein
LHVLGTPPAFILSQDQTLRKYLSPFQVFVYGKKDQQKLTSYHSSVVKVLSNSEGQILLCSPLLVKGFSDKTADVFF